MGEIVESTFAVEDVVNDDIWLKDLRRGLTVAVEATGVGYASDLERKINQLSKGDRISAELESKDDLRTIWAFTDVEFSPTETERPTT